MLSLLATDEKLIIEYFKFIKWSLIRFELIFINYYNIMLYLQSTWDKIITIPWIISIKTSSRYSTMYKSVNKSSDTKLGNGNCFTILDEIK